MHEITVLFVCPDNGLLSPLAEAYVNAKGLGFVRAFSAGMKQRAAIHPGVRRLLAETGIRAEALEPKTIDVFQMPMAPRPDMVVFLGGVEIAPLPPEWQGSVSVVHLPLEPRAEGNALQQHREAFQRIRAFADQELLGDFDENIAA
ncbi:low molecular weight phosphatase family protein [Roseibium sp.]|uniref:low molecular weight phosphatase family protein n=1 Tax=Roseibium sp. TaxID=1936156 RepID=UPI003A9727C5